MPAMLLPTRIFRRAVSALAVCALLAAPAVAGSPRALTQSDATLYQAAFAAYFYKLVFYYCITGIFQGKSFILHETGNIVGN